MPFNLFTTIDDPLALEKTQASGINNAGQIVGDYADTSGTHGFLRSGGTFITLDDPLAQEKTQASGINSAGQITRGCCSPSSGSVPSPYGKVGGGWVGSDDFTITNLTTGASITGSNNSNSGWLVAPALSGLSLPIGRRRWSIVFWG